MAELMPPPMDPNLSKIEFEFNQTQSDYFNPTLNKRQLQSAFEHIQEMLAESTSHEQTFINQSIVKEIQLLHEVKRY